MTASGDDRLDVSHVRAVIHVDDADIGRQRLASGNVLNLLDDTAVASADIEIVFNGAAIWALTRQSALTAELARLQARGVALLACNDSMRTAGVTVDQLIPNVTVVPSGISHLVGRQHEQWAYIRP
ncbi:DsrE family protein [Candidatus Mycobacterium methanotrophicum]|uniref:DsrE family protein n=1 Tax=Candidatus Mycobacterium methanotrophicum TaxID=2943498 RepID=A0ABY4QK76_9MYCO|nr:DsrE family protein [Candidatus Mycobacterium methanotrophicum]UQX11249.1 DsrE family protein [Candidatus Mycobacterium methanotrophicum]